MLLKVTNYDMNGNIIIPNKIVLELPIIYDLINKYNKGK